MGNFFASLPVFGGLFDDSEENALEQIQKNQRLYGGIELPDLKDYNPETYSYQGDYSPEQMRASLVQEDPALRQRQMDALAKMAGYADTGLSQVDDLGYAQARNIGAAQAKAGNAAAMQNAQARGVAGGGLEFAMREAANQGAAQRAQEAALQQAADSARQRALYTQAYGSGLSNMRNQDYNVNSGNTDILNRFNQLNATNNNTAQLRNLGMRQSINNANVDTRNDAQITNNNIRQNRFANSMKRADMIAGGNNQLKQYYDQQAAANAEKRKALGKAAGTAVGTMFGPGGAAAGGAIGEGTGNLF